MNTAAGTQDRRTIKVKDFLDDYRCAVGDLELIQKYHLSVRGLDRFVQLLVDRRILTSDEVALRNEKIAFAQSNPTNPETEQSAFMCPSCLITWPGMCDVCPNCGVVVQEYMAHQTMEPEPPADEHNALGQAASAPSEPGDSHVQTASEASKSPDGHPESQGATIENLGSLAGSSEESMAGNVASTRDQKPVVNRDETDAWSTAGGGLDDKSPRVDKESSHGSTDQDPIEIPLFENLSETAPTPDRPRTPWGSRLRQSFVWAEKVQAPAPGDPESDEDLIPGMPIGNDGEEIEPPVRMQVFCSSCASAMEPDLRQVYDRSGTRASLMLSGVFFLAGFVGAFILALFNGYSFARLLVVYGTGMLLMCAGVCLTAGFLMHMAKERVFRCPNCERVFPRA